MLLHGWNLKSNVMVLIFEESLDCKCDLGFFVPVLEVPFFGPSIWPLSPSASTKDPRPLLYSNFPQKWVPWPMLSFSVTFECAFDDFLFRALFGPILEGKSDQNLNAKKTTENSLQWKYVRKQTHVKIQFYMEKCVTSFDFMIFQSLGPISLYPPGQHLQFLRCCQRKGCCPPWCCQASLFI